MQAQRGAAGMAPGQPKEKSKPKAAKTEPTKPTSPQKSGLSFTEQHRLKELPDLVARLEAEIAKLGEVLADPELFTANPVKFKKATEALTERQDALSAAEDEWLELEEKASA